MLARVDGCSSACIGALLQGRDVAQMNGTVLCVPCVDDLASNLQLVHEVRAVRFKQHPKLGDGHLELVAIRKHGVEVPPVERLESREGLSYKLSRFFLREHQWREVSCEIVESYDPVVWVGPNATSAWGAANALVGWAELSSSRFAAKRTCT